MLEQTGNRLEITYKGFQLNKLTCCLLERKKPEYLKGKVRQDNFANVYGRLDQKTNGEVIHGALEDDLSLTG
ncbi:MAG: hypothetical protein ACOCVB_01385 [Bacillota bacterium]